jgi:hypothetical protein
MGAMADDVRRLCHVKNRSWGTETVYENYFGMIPRRVIAATIYKERSWRNKVDKEKALLYEFAAVGVAFSLDFIDVRAGGRILRMKEEKSRADLHSEHRAQWLAKDVTQWTGYRFREGDAPYVVKFDWGSEFRSHEFQFMLKENKVIALPSPPWYPQANGKLERANRDIQQWLAPLANEDLSPAEILAEVDRAVEDLNHIRPREILGYRTPFEVFSTSPRLGLDRDALYEEWTAHLQGLRLKSVFLRGIIPPRDLDFTSMRLAAMAVLQGHGLLHYFRGPGGPKV